MFNRKTIMAAIAVAGIAAASPALAGDVLLTVTAAGDQFEYDLDALQELPKVEFTTSTIWTEGESSFTGVALSVLLAEAGIDSGSVMATAINDYAVEIPVDEIDENAPIIAYLQDGEVMSPRDKGPLWVIYPYDEDEKYQTETVYSRSIWQLDRIMGAK
ncbi:molybdopterin-dependent oxidoreductase [Paracoccus sp. C2R09]|nr:molybdopterin-dependent oxidoreductase [Paracoccus sp. C2R09]